MKSSNPLQANNEVGVVTANQYPN